MKACVFVGPTLAPEEVARAIDAVPLPPVQQGDVYRAARRHRPRAIGIVDGYFQHVPSVWHKEILWAMAEGIHVFGSASMGALRAAELAAFGMRGVGRIFTAYRTGLFEPYRDAVFEDEDEVAIVHAPADGGYTPLSEAMVNIRSTLAAAATAEIIGVDTRDGLVRMAKGVFYPDRSWERLLRAAATARLPEREVQALRAWLPRGRIDQKRDDALAMLAAMRELLTDDPPPARVSYVFQRSEMWQRAVAAEARSDGPDDPEGAGREALLDELRLAGTYRDARRAGLLRWAGLHECDRQNFQGSFEDRRAVEAELRDRWGTFRRRDVDRWLAASDLDEPGRAQLVGDEARLRQLDRTLGPLADPHIVAHLRATGGYPRYAARAQAKARMLAQAGGDPEHLDGLTRLRLAAWYFEHRLGGRIPDDIEAYSADHGYVDAEAFYQALWREYRYVLHGAQGEPDAPGTAADRPAER